MISRASVGRSRAATAMPDEAATRGRRPAPGSMLTRSQPVVAAPAKAT